MADSVMLGSLLEGNEGDENMDYLDMFPDMAEMADRYSMGTLESLRLVIEQDLQYEQDPSLYAITKLKLYELRHESLMLSWLEGKDVITQNEKAVNNILTKEYMETHDMPPTWSNLTPDALIIERGSRAIVEFAVARDKKNTIRMKEEKYKKMAEDSNCRLIIIVLQPGDMYIDENKINSDLEEFEELNKKLNALIHNNGLWDQVEALMKGIKPKEPIVKIPSELQGSWWDKPLRTEDYREDIRKKSTESAMFKATTKEEVIEGFEELFDEIQIDYEVKSNKAQMMPFLYCWGRKSWTGLKEWEITQRHVGEFGNCKNSLLNELGLAHRNPQKKYQSGPLRQLLADARVQGYYNKESKGYRKEWTMPEEEINEAIERVEDAIDKLDCTGPAITHAEIPTSFGVVGSDLAGECITYSQDMLISATRTQAYRLCRFVGSIANRVLHLNNVDRKKILFHNTGFSSCGIITLPHDNLIDDKSTIPFIPYMIEDEDSLSVIGTEIISKDKTHSGHRISIGKPQRLNVNQWHSLRNADLKLVATRTLLNIPPSMKLNLSAIALLLCSPKMNISYLCENARFLGQLSMSKMSSIKTFIKDKFKQPVKSYLEAWLIEGLAGWSCKIIETTRLIQPRIKIGESGSFGELYSATEMIKIPSLVIPDLHCNLKDFTNQLHLLIQLRNKNMHDKYQGLASLYRDLCKAGEGWVQDRDIPVKNMTTESKFTYNSGFIRDMALFASTKHYKQSRNLINRNLKAAGMLDSPTTIATSRGSREIQTDREGYLQPSTNMLEVLKRKDKDEILEVAKESNTHNLRVEYAQKQQRGNDRAIGITTFPHRCMLKVGEDIARACNKCLPNEAISKSGERKIISMQEKLQRLYSSHEKKDPIKSRVILLSADNSKHSEHDALDKYKVAWSMKQDVEEEYRRAVIKCIDNMRDREMWLPRQIHKFYLSMLEKTNQEELMRSGLIHMKRLFNKKQWCHMPAGWIQGMFNNISTNLHAEAQEYAFHIIQQMLNIEIDWVGDVHSDDSWMGVSFTCTEEQNADDLSKSIINMYYWCMQAAGFRLNLKKSFVSDSVVEFLSRYMILGDQISTWIKSGLACISELPCRGLATDMPAAVSHVQTYLRDGGYLCNTYALIAVATAQVDRLYSTGHDQENDVEKWLGLRRTDIPLQMGGLFDSDPISLMSWGPRAHNMELMKRTLDYRYRNHVQFRRILEASFNAGVELTGVVGDPMWGGPVNKPNPKKAVAKANQLIEELGLKDVGLAYVRDHPLAKMIRPENHEDCIKQMSWFVTTPDYALGMAPTNSTATIIRLSGSVRGQVWRKGDKMMTLKEWLEDARKTEVNIDRQEERFDTLMSASEVSTTQQWVASIELGNKYPCEGVKSEMIRVTPLAMSGERLPNANRCMMKLFDETMIKESERATTMSSDWEQKQLNYFIGLKEELELNGFYETCMQMMYSLITHDRLKVLSMSCPLPTKMSMKDAALAIIEYRMEPGFKQTIEDSGQLGAYRPRMEIAANRQRQINALQEVSTICRYICEDNVKGLEGSIRLFGGEINWAFDNEKQDLMQCLERAHETRNVYSQLQLDSRIAYNYIKFGNNEFNDAELAAQVSNVISKKLSIETPQRRKDVKGKTMWTGELVMLIQANDVNARWTASFTSEQRGSHSTLIKVNKPAKLEVTRVSEVEIALIMQRIKRYTKLTDTDLLKMGGNGSVGFNGSTWYIGSHDENAIRMSLDTSIPDPSGGALYRAFKIDNSYTLLGDRSTGKRKHWIRVRFPRNYGDRPLTPTLKLYEDVNLSGLKCCQVSFNNVQAKAGFIRSLGIIRMGNVLGKSLVEPTGCKWDKLVDECNEITELTLTSLQNDTREITIDIGDLAGDDNYDDMWTDEADGGQIELEADAERVVEPTFVNSESVMITRANIANITEALLGSYYRTAISKFETLIAIRSCFKTAVAAWRDMNILDDNLKSSDNITRVMLALSTSLINDYKNMSELQDKVLTRRNKKFLMNIKMNPVDLRGGIEAVTEGDNIDTLLKRDIIAAAGDLTSYAIKIRDKDMGELDDDVAFDI